MIHPSGPLDEGNLGRLLLVLSSRPGANTVAIRLPEDGGLLTIAEGCGVTPAHAAEIVLLLGQPGAAVRYAAPV